MRRARFRGSSPASKAVPWRERAGTARQSPLLGLLRLCLACLFVWFWFDLLLFPRSGRRWRRAHQVPVTWISPQQQLIAFVVERLDVPRRSEPAGEARPVIINIAIDHGATRSQDTAVVEWPSSRKSVAHQRGTLKVGDGWQQDSNCCAWSA